MNTGPSTLHVRAPAFRRRRDPATGEGLLRITGRRPPSGKRPRNNNTNIYIGTYNPRTISRETDLATIIAEKDNIQCDILGLCETRRREAMYIRWEDGSTVALGAGEGDTTVGGVGFIVSLTWST